MATDSTSNARSLCSHTRLTFIQRNWDLPIAVDALENSNALLPGHYGMWWRQSDVEMILLESAAQLDHIAKALGCDHAGISAGELEHGICHDGRSQHERGRFIQQGSRCQSRIAWPSWSLH